MTSIGDGVFRSCSALTTVTIGSGVKKIQFNAFSKCPELKDVYCLAETVPTTQSNAFEDSYIEYATLHVPSASLSAYKVAAPWRNFGNIVDINGGGTQKCDKPTISYNNGKLTFNCTTADAVCQSTITDSDIKSYTGNEINLTVTYTISVYATKSGYQNSETATATLCWIDMEPKTEGITNGVANVPAQAVLIQSEGGMLTIQGADDGTPVSVYSVNGTQAGFAISQNGQAVIATNLQTDSVAIVKIGQKSVKVAIK